MEDIFPCMHSHIPKQFGYNIIVAVHVPVDFIKNTLGPLVLSGEGHK